MREHFYFLIDQLAGTDPPREPAPSKSVLVQALAHSIGIYAASYHNWCEANARLSREMQTLGQVLSEGI